MSTKLSSLRWIEDLVAIDTISCHSNLPLIELVAGRLEDAGIATTVRLNKSADKANLIATIPASSGSTAGGLVLSGHTDVVPVDGQDWGSDPFTISVRDERIYGRGTADMKGFIGVALAMVPRMLQVQLSEPIHFALSYDEEVGLLGGAQMIDDFRDLGLTPRLCVVGEPTGMQVIGAHKSFGLVTITVRGRDGHSSLAPNLVSAAFYGAQMVAFIQELAEEFEFNGPVDHAYDIPFSTISVNEITSGSSGNTVPSHCHIRLDLRTIPQVDPQEVLGRIRQQANLLQASMQAQDPGTGIEITTIGLAPGLESSNDSPLVATLAAAGVTAEGNKMAYGTEAGFFHAFGIDTVVCGPGNIAQAHIADEYVEIDQIRECERVLSALVNTLCEV